MSGSLPFGVDYDPYSEGYSEDQDDTSDDQDGTPDGSSGDDSGGIWSSIKGYAHWAYLWAKERGTGSSSSPNSVSLGDGGADDLSGDASDDTLFAGAGSDILTGGGGSDVLHGGSGADTLQGGLNEDVLAGGNGADTFVFTSAQEAGSGTTADTITDFQSGRDTIDLSSIDADTSSPGSQAFTWIGGQDFSDVAGQVRYSGGVLQGDTDSDGKADFQINVNGPVAAGDVIL